MNCRSRFSLLTSRFVFRFRFGSVFLVTLAASMATLAGQAPSQLPLDPVRETGQSVIGAYEGWYQNSDGSYSLLVGYFNRNQKEALEIPVGPNNRIEPGGPDMGQPTHFLPRRQWGVFVIRVPKDFGKNILTWTLVANGQTTVIPMNLDPLWIVAPFKDVALGNTPPSIRFASQGDRHEGPPIAISQSYTTTASHPLTLSVWVSDDGVRPPEARQRPITPTITWSKFRGSGNVVFDQAQPVVDEKTGSATTNATFTTAGEYVLRVQVNDATGEGGGGFQCCWTNAYVKVVVSG
jgi:hypothetical protein